MSDLFYLRCSFFLGVCVGIVIMAVVMLVRA